MKQLYTLLLGSALWFITPTHTQGQVFDTLCTSTVQRFWLQHYVAPLVGGIIEFHVVGGQPVPVDTLLASSPVASIAYTGVFGAPTFAGGGSGATPGIRVWDGTTWNLWSGTVQVCTALGGHMNYLYYWSPTFPVQSLWVFDGITNQRIWDLPAGYIRSVADLAVDGAGNAVMVLRANASAPDEIRLISPQGVELSVWNLSTQLVGLQGASLVGNRLFFCATGGCESVDLGVPPAVTMGPTFPIAGTFTDMADCPTANMSLTTMARASLPNGQLGIFPNPATDQFQVVLPTAFDGANADIFIHDAQGRLVWTGTSAKAKFMVNAALEPGHYVVTARNAHASTSAKLMVVGN